MRLLAHTTDCDADPRSDVDRPASDYDFSPLSDGDLLDAWNRDEHSQALATLVQRYSVMVLSVCRRRCRSDADADDAFQTTFLYLARNSRKIRQPERLAGWLHRVAQRAAVATWKSSQRESEPMVEPPANPDDPLDRLTQRHEAIVLDEELADLPDHYRAALVMHVYEGLPLQQLADHFGTTIGSIRGRLQRGKQLLAQRLRYRGVVPVLAFAAANAWTATAVSAAGATESFTAATGAGVLPDPPIPPSLLESLLSQGIRLMPSLYTVAGILGGSAILAVMMSTGGTSGGETSRGPRTITLPPAVVVGQLGGAPVQVKAGENNRKNRRGNAGKKNKKEQPDKTEPQPGNVAGQMVAMSGNVTGGNVTGGNVAGGGGLGGAEKGMVWANQPTIPKPTTVVAVKTNEALDTESSYSIAAPLIELPDRISEVAGIPVLMDDRGIEFAKVDMSMAEVKFEANDVPLRTALRTMLRPHGLKAVVENEGLVITADPSALVHQGIGTAQWINIDNEAANNIAEQLQQIVSLNFVDAPLSDVLDEISQENELPIIVDTRGMEEVGMSIDTPVSIAVNHIKLQNALQIFLSDLDLVFTIQGESLVITTPEVEDGKLLHRIYWLESTGVAVGDYDTIMSLITSTISPDAWEELGGSSTMAQLSSSRPALLISTTYGVHHSIEKLFQTLRETHFGADPVLERVQVPTPIQFGGAFGGGMGGGGMGGGGFM